MGKKWVMLALLLLVACQQGGQQPTKDFPAEFRTGSQGLVMTFVANLPPTRLFDTEEFNTLIDIQNVGASNVGSSGDKIYISGFDPSIITGISTAGAQIPVMEGKTRFNTQGTIDRVSFRGSIRRLTTDRYPVRILATACYNYETVANANVCVDPDPFAPQIRPKVCQPAAVGLGSQGAPVSVTNIELDSRRGKTGFRITVANVGGGDVFRFGADALGKCNPNAPRGLEYDELDYVQIADVVVSGQSIKSSCRPLDRDHLRLTGGRGQIFCELATSGSSAYQTPMTVTLRYGYRNQLAKDIEIVKTP